jgi:hypothetical protein
MAAQLVASRSVLSSTEMMFVPYRKHVSTGLYGRLREELYFLYVDDVRTSKEKHFQVSTACYRENFACLYVYDVRTSQKTPWVSTACYGVSLILLFVDVVRTSQEAHLLQEQLYLFTLAVVDS